MKKNILNYINKIQGYKTAIKNLHWSAKHMSEHKLLDEIADSVANNQDEIAEMCQGLYGKIKLNELKPKRYKITNSKKMLFDLLRDTKSFYSTIKGRELSGVSSVVETFIGDINKFIYLMEMCIKEDIKRNLLFPLNENIVTNEKELRETIQSAIKKSLNENTQNMSFENFLETFNEEKSIEIYSAEMKIKYFKEEVKNFQNYIRQIIGNVQDIGGEGNVYVEYSPNADFLRIHIDMPSIKGFATDDEYNDMESYIWDYTNDMKKYIQFTISLDETPSNEQGIIQAHIDIDEIPTI